MTTIILALDALDAALVDQWGLDALQLDTHGQMETFANQQPEPFTPEVWATIATGDSPSEHGVTGADVSSWDNPILDAASGFTGWLPTSVRQRLGKIASTVTNADFEVGATDADSMFDGSNRYVRNWPGVKGTDIDTVWDVMADESQSDAEFRRWMRAHAAEKFAWAGEHLQQDVVLAGVHIHALDAFGHADAHDEQTLRNAYEWADEWVSWLQDRCGPDDNLIVLSDHGMVVDWYADSEDHGLEPGSHSWRAYAASTLDSVPEHVADVRDWIEPHLEDGGDSSSEEYNPDMEKLRDLGYVD